MEAVNIVTERGIQQAAKNQPPWYLGNVGGQVWV